MDFQLWESGVGTPAPKLFKNQLYISTEVMRIDYHVSRVKGDW